MDLELYDSDIEIESAEEVSMDAKYSEIAIDQMTSLDMESYDNECEFGEIGESVRISDKYSEFEIGSSPELKLTMYDGKLKMERSDKVNTTSKYAEITILSAGSWNIQTSYDDVFKIRELDELTAIETKYSSYNIDKINRKVYVNSYDDVLDITRVDAGFEQFEADAKYSDVILPLNDLPGYTIKANMKFGKLKYPEPSELILLKESNDVTELDVRIGSPSDVIVKIKSYDCNIRLN